MKQDLATEAMKGTPAVAGAAYSIVNPNTVVMVLTGIYIVIQIAYLCRKWWREEKEARRKPRRADPEADTGPAPL